MRTVFRLTWAMGLAISLHSAAAFSDDAAPVIKSAGSDERGRIVVNDEPFFPILMYDVPLDPASLTMFRAHGFNTLSATVDDGETLRKQGLYAAAHAADTQGKNLDGVLFGIGMDSPALNWKQGLHDKTRADVAHMKSLFPNRPIFHAIGYWEDEPQGVFENTLPSREKYDDLIPLLDVSAPYLYPLPYQPVSTVGDALRRADTAGLGKKPLLPVLQLFKWKPEDKYPTPDELRCMAFLALIHGADGIGYYSFNYVTGKTGTNLAKEEPELWASVKSLNQEIATLGEFLMRSEPDDAFQVAADPSSVVWRAVHSNDASLILITNVTNQPQAMALTGDDQLLIMEDLKPLESRWLMFVDPPYEK